MIKRNELLIQVNNLDESLTHIAKWKKSIWKGYILHYWIYTTHWERWDFPGGSEVKNPPAMQELLEMWVWSLGRENTQKEVVATHSSILVWRIPWTEEPGGLGPWSCEVLVTTEATVHIGKGKILQMVNRSVVTKGFSGRKLWKK